jgi:hypothetical protein
MTQDEIIEMAEQAGMVYMDYMDYIRVDSMEQIERLVNLVAAKATEEANARANASWTLMCKKMVAIEREACAKLCETKHFSSPVREFGAKECAIAIRARGEQALAQLKQDGDCKKCKDGCPACDARKLQKEAHDLL